MLRLTARSWVGTFLSSYIAQFLISMASLIRFFVIVVAKRAIPFTHCIYSTSWVFNSKAQNASLKKMQLPVRWDKSSIIEERTWTLGFKRQTCHLLCEPAKINLEAPPVLLITFLAFFRREPIFASCHNNRKKRHFCICRNTKYPKVIMIMHYNQWKTVFLTFWLFIILVRNSHEKKKNNSKIAPLSSWVRS